VCSWYTTFDAVTDGVTLFFPQKVTICLVIVTTPTALSAFQAIVFAAFFVNSTAK